MYSLEHVVWIVVCAVLIVTSFVLIRKTKMPLSKVLSIACVIAALSELVKILSTIQIVPSTSGNNFYAYLETKQLPLHLCSFQLVMIFIARFSKNEKTRNTILATLYPLAILGGLFAIFLPSVFSSIPKEQAFTHPQYYQTFIYHSMLVVLGLTIATSKEVKIGRENYLKTLGFVVVCAFVSIYINSIFASPVYEDGVLKAVEYTTNFFFVYEAPIGYELKNVTEWYIYILIIAALAVTLLFLFYLPFMIKRKKSETK